jgi:hypothetical protein
MPLRVALVLKMNTYQAGESISDPFAKTGQWALTTYATADELAACDISPRAYRSLAISSAECSGDVVRMAPRRSLRLPRSAQMSIPARTDHEQR